MKKLLKSTGLFEEEEEIKEDKEKDMLQRKSENMNGFSVQNREVNNGL